MLTLNKGKNTVLGFWMFIQFEDVILDYRFDRRLGNSDILNDPDRF
jgi:hypothetical protein